MSLLQGVGIEGFHKVSFNLTFMGVSILILRVRAHVALPAYHGWEVGRLGI